MILIPTKDQSRQRRIRCSALSIGQESKPHRDPEENSPTAHVNCIRVRNVGQ